MSSEITPLLSQIGVPNPWREIEPGPPPYRASVDRPVIERHNRRVEALHRCPLDVYPEPYLGDPNAPVLLLNLNPGYNEESPRFHAQPAVTDLCIRNLRHEGSEYPFYALHPQYLRCGGSSWWSQSLQYWIREYGAERVSRAFFVIEMFPYSSVRYRALSEPLPSQQYSLALVEAKLQAGCTAVIMRQETNWKQRVPALRNAFVVNNPQSKSLSPPDPYRRGNLEPAAVAAIHAALRGL